MPSVQYAQITESDERNHSSAVVTALAEEGVPIDIPSAIRSRLCTPASLRILDLGGGDGKFTEAVLKSASASIQLFFSEKHGSLAEDYVSKLHSFAPIRIDPLREGLARRVGLPAPIADYCRWLYSWCQGVLDEHGTFDLIICARVLHYWQTGSLDIIQGLFDSLLAPGGILWIVAPNRSCSLFQQRIQYLADNRLPDILDNSFADGLLDRIRCILPNHDPSILSSEAGNHVKIPQTALPYFWHVDKLPSFPDGLDYSETHILFTRPPATDPFAEPLRTMKDPLGGVRTVARCMQFLRGCLPDAQFHNVAIALIHPNLSELDPMPSPEEIHLPWTARSYEVRQFGYFFGIDNDDPLTQYFLRNPSLLFYRQFFLGSAMVDPSISATNSTEAFVRPLGRAKAKSLTEYSCIHSYPGTNEDQHSPNEKPVFDEAFQSFLDVFGSYYCEHNRAEAAPPNLWLFALGVNILPDLPYVFSTERHCSSGCAFFAVVQTSDDLLSREAILSNRIKTRLLQFMAEGIYGRLNSEMRALDKQAQMLSIVERPLRQISDALSTMQSSAQEVRAILFEPEEALFASHENVAPFFIDGQCNIFPEAEIEDLVIHHSPGAYKKLRDTRLILAGLTCAMLGELKQLRSQQHEVLIIKTAARVFREKRARPSTSDLVRQIEWLFCRYNDGYAELLKAKLISDGGDLLAVVPKVTDEQCFLSATRTAITNVKEALYAPFKPETQIWTTSAFELLFSNPVFSQARNKGRCLSGTGLQFDSESTPLSFASVLAFVREISVSLCSESRYVHSVTVDGDQMVITIHFSSPIIGGEKPELDVTFVRKALDRVLSAPRDWRVESANYGDVVRPFIMLANKFLGLHELNGWNPIQVTGDSVLSVERKAISGKQTFSVEAVASSIVLNWGQEI